MSPSSMGLPDGGDTAAEAKKPENLRGLSRSSEEGDDRQNQKDNKKDFRDPGGGPGNSTKAEESSNQGDDEENNGVVRAYGSVIS